MGFIDSMTALFFLGLFGWLAYACMDTEGGHDYYNGDGDGDGSLYIKDEESNPEYLQKLFEDEFNQEDHESF